MTRVASKLQDSSSRIFCGSDTIGTNGSSGKCTSRGCGSKVTATDCRSCCLAVSSTSLSTARCPRCTPSKLPSVTTDGDGWPIAAVPAQYCTCCLPLLRERLTLGKRFWPVLIQPIQADNGQDQRDESVTYPKRRPHGRLGEHFGSEQRPRSNDYHPK